MNNMNLQNEIKVIRNNFDKIESTISNDGEINSLYVIEKINHIIMQLYSIKKNIINGEE